MCATSFTSAVSQTDQQHMPGSLITSNDFIGMNDFMLDANDSVNGAPDVHFETSRPHVFDDISMLNVSYETAEANNTVTVNDFGEDTFNQLLVQSSFCKEADRTPVRILQRHESVDAITIHQQVLDATYDNNASTNRTMVVLDACQPLNITVDAVPSVLLQPRHAVGDNTVQSRAEESFLLSNDSVNAAERSAVLALDTTLSDTFQLDQIQLELDNTFEMNKVSSQQQPKMDAIQSKRDYGKSIIYLFLITYYIVTCLGLQSTPIKLTMLNNGNLQHTLNDPSVVHISPIASATTTSSSPNNKFNTYVRPKIRPQIGTSSFVPIKKDYEQYNDGDDLNPALTEYCIATTNTSQSEIDERQSLTNFEEFEKSLSLCQSDHDFDNMLDVLASRSQDNRCAVDAQMRQSLDHIKKRHSLLNLEKQLEDQQHRRITAASAAECSAHSSNTLSNRSMASSSTTTSTSVLNTSASSAGERLLRRSRVTDDVCTSLAMESSACSGYQLTLSDSKENVQQNIANNRNDLEQLGNGIATSIVAIDIASNSSPGVVSDSAVIGNKLEIKPRIIPNNRDRFKTMRISKQSPGTDAVPQLIDSHYDVKSANDGSGLSSMTDKDTNSLALDNRDKSAVSHRRSITRPSQLSRFTMRRDASLTNCGSNTIQMPFVPVPKANTGSLVAKAKSIQNLVDRSMEKSAEETNARGQKEVYCFRSAFVIYSNQTYIPPVKRTDV